MSPSLRAFHPTVLSLFRFIAGVIALACAAAPSGHAQTSPAPASLGAGATLPSLQVGTTTYHDVRVRSVTVRSIVILHRDGLGSIRLRDLSPDLQKAFGYSPEAEAAADAAAKNTPKPAVKKPAAPRAAPSKFDALLQQFNQPPEIRPEVDLRPRFAELKLYAKDQGRRPSCAVFAVVSALEFQNAELLGRPEKLSEEYLIWACRKTLGRDLPATTGDASAETKTGDEDLGFTLFQVVAALRTYGIPAESAMPDTLGLKMKDIHEPSPELVNEARLHCRVAVYPVPQIAIVGNLVHALNAGVPVSIGLKWPNDASIYSGYLSLQEPMFGGGHAVTVVGYCCKTQSLDDVVFIFKNSWGVQWGAAGFGHVTADYVKKNLIDAEILEVKNPDN